MTKAIILDHPQVPATYHVWDDTKRRSVGRRLTKKRLEAAADNLDAAAKLLKAENWRSGAWCDNKGRMCAQGAIAKAAVGDPNQYTALAALDAIKVADSVAFITPDPEDEYDEGENSIMSFNDVVVNWRDPEAQRKHSARVRKALRAAARAAREKAATLKR